MTGNTNGNGGGSKISVEQQRLWVLNQLEHARRAFNVPIFLRLKGRLDRAALERSIQAVLNRHRVLTSRFMAVNGNVLQVPAACNSEVLSFADLTHLPEADREERAQRLAIQEQTAPFDLEAGPVLRSLLLRLSSQEHILLITIHRSVCDSISADLLLKEIAQLYGSPRAGTAPVLQYADYAAWQNEFLNSSSAAQDLGYWKRQLEGMAAGLELPTDYARPPVPSFDGKCRTIVLSSPLVTKLRSISAQENISLRHLVLSTFVALLCRYTGLEDIVLGTERPGRDLSGSEHAVGPFATALVLRVDASGDPSVRELLSRVRKTCGDAETHNRIPFAKLVEALRLERDLSRNPLFQVKFVPEVAQEVPQFGGLKVRALPSQTLTEALDLTLRVTEHADSLEASFSYATDLFSDATIQRMCGHWEQLVTAASQDLNQRVFALPMLAPAEREQLISGWNKTSLDYPDTCIHQLFEKQAQNSPKIEAVSLGGQSLTYSELNSRANQLARYLRGQGVGSNSLVGLYLERSLEMVVALLGVLKAGAAYVPLDPAYPRERIAFILDDADIRLVLTQDALRESLPSQNAALISLDTDWTTIAAEQSVNLDLPSSPRDLAYVLYTSGSTGKPKGVEIEHRSVVNFLTTMQKEPGFGSTDVLLAVTTLSFDIAGLELYLPLVSGGRILLASRDQASDAISLQNLMQRGVTVMQATPATWRLLLESGWPGHPRLKVLCGGEALPLELAQQLLPRCRELWNMYGPTETTIWSSIYRVRDISWSMAPIGKPIGNTQMYVLDKNRHVLPVGVAGELYIGGDGLARGYKNRPDLTAERFVTNPFVDDPSARVYMTGDLVRYLPDGNIQYLGRIDNQVKVRGFRIELGEIESALGQHPAVQQAVAVVREDAGDKRIVAYFVLQKGQTLEVADLRSFAKQKLPEYMLPSRFVALDQFPLTPNGKVDRKALPAPSREAATPSSEAPRDEMEAKLVSIFESVLGVRPIGVTDDFFELGGHSLIAARLMGEIRKLSGKQLSLKTLFQGATVRHLRNVLAEEAPVDDGGTLTTIQQGDASIPPFFAVISPGESGLGYAILARHMGAGYPFYQLQASTPIAIERPYTWEELENLAAEYVSAMRKVQPSGPYHFGGMCDGAHIAIRMARRLEQAGEQVGMMAVFDTWVLENSQHPLLWKVAYYSERLAHFRSSSWREKMSVVSRVSGRVARKLLGRQARSDWSRAYWPEKSYVPPRFSGRVTLFRKPKQPYYYKRDPQMGWGQRAGAGVDVLVLPIHHAEMLREPSVQVLANSLVERLQKAYAAGVHRSRQQENLQVLEPAAAGASHEAF